MTITRDEAVRVLQECADATDAIRQRIAEVGSAWTYLRNLGDQQDARNLFVGIWERNKENAVRLWELVNLLGK